MAEWTKEPWTIAQPWAGFSEMRGAGGELIFGLAAGAEHERQPEDVCEANARRMEQRSQFCAGTDLTPALSAGITLGGLVGRLRAWEDMIANCAGVQQNPDSLPQMLLLEMRHTLSLFPGGGDDA